MEGDAEIDDLTSLIRWSPYIPERIRPNRKQAAALMATEEELLMGGSAGPGKTWWLLMAGLQYADVAGYNGIILRKNFPQLWQAGNLIPLSHEWLSTTDASWNEQKKVWTFPEGATLGFGHLDDKQSKYNYQGGAYHFVGWDELTQQLEEDYMYVSFSRRRRALAASHIPVRVRATANPGGVGHEWVYQRFMVETSPNRLFIPATLEDNPDIDADEYRKSLEELDYITRAQLLHGDWTVRPAGGYFQRQWFEIVDAPPIRSRSVRYWDLAGTEAAPGKDPDWTVGLKLARDYNGVYYVLDVQRFRARPMAVEERMRQTAQLDGVETAVFFEQEPGSSGVSVAERLAKVVFHGFSATPDRKTGDKVTLARPVSSQAEAGNIKIIRGAWNNTFLNELEAFPTPRVHDDQCLAAGTLIATPNGSIPIERIERGDLVLTRSGASKVEAACQTGTAVSVRAVRLADGRGLVGTPNHPVFTDCGLRPIDTLCGTMALCLCEERMSNSTGIYSTATQTLRTKLTGTISKRIRGRSRSTGSRLCTRRYGRAHTVLSLRAAISTIATGTPSITDWTIWFASRWRSIVRNMRSQRARGSLLTWNRYAPWLLNGIRAMRDMRGTRRMASRLMPSGKLGYIGANGVVARLRLSTEGVSVSAGGSVLTGRDTTAQQIFERYAPNAALSSSSTRECGPSTVPVAVVSVVDSGSADVYNLQVEAGEYFANGVLVHNCDSLSGAFRALGIVRPESIRGYEELMEASKKPAGWSWEGAV